MAHFQKLVGQFVHASFFCQQLAIQIMSPHFLKLNARIGHSSNEQIFFKVVEIKFF